MVNKESNEMTHLETPAQNSRKQLRIFLSITMVILLVVIAYFAYVFLLKYSKSGDDDRKSLDPPRVIQLDVLNGCGAKGIGARFTGFLRIKGFDVVEMKNYKTFQIPQTLVVDRIGDLRLARQIAGALGVSEKNVIQQINPDYFVDVSVIIGKDYLQLNPSH